MSNPHLLSKLTRGAKWWFYGDVGGELAMEQEFPGAKKLLKICYSGVFGDAESESAIKTDWGCSWVALRGVVMGEMECK